jgi:hypothetical protein
MDSTPTPAADLLEPDVGHRIGARHCGLADPEVRHAWSLAMKNKLPA